MKIAIVAKAPRTRHYARDLDETYRIWVLAAGWNMPELEGKPIERIYEVHPRWMLKDPIYIAGLWDWLTTFRDAPVYMLDPGPEIPASVQYPLDAALDLCANVRRGDAQNKYFTSTLDYMMAAAILEQPEEIYLVGFDMATDTEYRYQREGLSFWAGLAAGRGIRVTLPPGASMLKSRMYGLENAQVISGERLAQMLADLLPKLLTAESERQRLSENIETDEDADKFYSAEWHFHTLNGAAATVRQLLEKNSLVAPDGAKLLGRQLLEQMYQAAKIERDTALGSVNFARGVLSDRQANKASAEDCQAANLDLATKRARFHGLDGSLQVLNRLVQEIDGQEAEWKDVMVDVG